MNKKTIFTFTVFLAVLCTLTACGSKKSPYGVLIVDKKGMEHVIMTDASGVTVIDAAGNLVEVVTDSVHKQPIAAPMENGTYAAEEYQTGAVTFPDMVQNGKTVENQYCTITLPKGWAQTGSVQMILEKSGTDAQITVNPGIDNSLSAALDRMDSDRAALNAEFDYEQTETTLGGLFAVCEKYTFIEVVRSVYLVENDYGTVIQIACTAPKDQYDSIDFDAVLQNIQFKGTAE